MIVNLDRMPDMLRSRDALVVIITELIDEAVNDDWEHDGERLALEIVSLVERSRFFRFHGANNIREWILRREQEVASAS